MTSRKHHIEIVVMPRPDLEQYCLDIEDKLIDAFTDLAKLRNEIKYLKESLNISNQIRADLKDELNKALGK